MSTYCISKAKLLIQCGDINLFRKGDFFRQPSTSLQEIELKGLIDICHQSIERRGFDVKNPFLHVQLADAIHFAYFCHFSVVDEKVLSDATQKDIKIIELLCEHAIMNTKITIFIIPDSKIRYHPQKNPFDEDVFTFEFPKLQMFPRIISASYSGEGRVEGCSYNVYYNCESAFLVTYKYILVCYEPLKKYPCLVVSLEMSLNEDRTTQAKNTREDSESATPLWFMCVFFADTHKNLGVVEQAISVQEFEHYALEIAAKILSTARNIHIDQLQNEL
jgi:hypothetical protein